MSNLNWKYIYHYIYLKVKVKVLYLSRLRLIVHKDKTSVCGKTLAYDKTSVYDQM